MAVSITPFETTNWSTTTTPLTISVTGALTGDKIIVIYGGDNGTGGSNVSAATVTTTGGSTGAWTEPQEGLAASNQAWISSSQADVTADGTVTVSLSRTQSTGLLWGGFALLCRGHGGIGVSARSAPSAAETVSLTVSGGSAVGMLAIDWDALAVVAFSPSGSTEIERSQQGAGPDLTFYAAYWPSEAAGTRGYGIGTSSTTNLHIIAIEILDASAGPTPMWRPARMAPPLPGTPLSFPFGAPQFSTEVVAAGPVGDATAVQRSSTEAIGIKATSGATTAYQRTATTEIGTKQTTGSGLVATRATTASTGKKNATGTAASTQRATTISTGRKNATGAGTDQQRSTTTSSAVKAAAGGGAVQQRATTQGTGSSTPAVGGVVAQRITTSSSGIKNASGSGAARCRAATASTGLHQGVGTGIATTRTQSLSTGVHRGTGTGAAAARISTATSGVHRGTGITAAAATCRTSTQTIGIRAAAGAGRVQQRVIVIGFGEQVAPFQPLLDPAATARANLATAHPATATAAAQTRTGAAATSHPNQAHAAPRPNPAEATP